MKTLPSFCLLLVLCSFSNASSLSIAPAYLHFNYKERDRGNNTLNTEKGYLQGVELIGSFDVTHAWHLESAFRLYHGAVDYDGATQNGTPLQTNTDQHITSVSSALARTWGDNKAWLLHVNHTRWQRDIQPNANVLGLLEEYTWLEYGLGFRHVFSIGPRDKLQYEIRAFYVNQAEVDVDLTALDAGDIELKQGDGAGGELAVSWQHNLSKQFSTGAAFSYKRWGVGESPSRRILTSRGFSSIQEPKSRTENSVLRLYLSVHF